MFGYVKMIDGYYKYRTERHGAGEDGDFYAAVIGCHKLNAGTFVEYERIRVNAGEIDIENKKHLAHFLLGYKKCSREEFETAKNKVQQTKRLRDLNARLIDTEAQIRLLTQKVIHLENNKKDKSSKEKSKYAR